MTRNKKEGKKEGERNGKRKKKKKKKEKEKEKEKRKVPTRSVLLHAATAAVQPPPCAHFAVWTGVFFDAIQRHTVLSSAQVLVSLLLSLFIILFYFILV